MLVPPPPAAPQQQEPDGATVGSSATGTLLGSCRQWWCQAPAHGRQRSRLPLLPHRQVHTVLAVRGGCFGAIITPALWEAPLSSFLPTCCCMYRPNHQQCGCALGTHFTFSFQPPTSDRLSFGLPHLCSKCHLPSQHRERVDAVFHEQCGARTACTRTGDYFGVFLVIKCT